MPFQFYIINITFSRISHIQAIHFQRHQFHLKPCCTYFSVKDLTSVFHYATEFVTISFPFHLTAIQFSCRELHQVLSQNRLLFSSHPRQFVKTRHALHSPEMRASEETNEGNSSIFFSRQQPRGTRLFPLQPSQYSFVLKFRYHSVPLSALKRNNLLFWYLHFMHSFLYIRKTHSGITRFVNYVGFFFIFKSFFHFLRFCIKNNT